MDENQLNLNSGLDSIIHQLEKGNTIEGLKNGRRYIELEQVKEWKSRYGYQFHIYSNDHFIDNKPHFHLLKRSEGIDCRFFFNGEKIDCKGNNKLKKKVIEALNYFLSLPNAQKQLKQFWNRKNPDLFIQ